MIESAVSVGANRLVPPRVVIIGGCGGIGRVLVHSLVTQGCSVIVADLPSSIDRYPPMGAAQVLAMDATSADQVQGAATTIRAKYGAIDGLVYLTGYMPPLQPLASVAESVLRESLDVNLMTAWHTTSALMPLLKAGEHSAVVLAASGLGAYARPGMGPYSIAKAGIIAMTRQLALEQAPDVRVNAVAPAAIDTAFLRGGTGRSDEQEDPHVDTDLYRTVVPMKRIGQPEDVTGPIEFLLSSAAQYMTGQTLFINGGTYG